MNEGPSGKAEREVAHGKRISGADPEKIWGWKTTAGQVRAARRAEWISASAQLGPGRRALEIGCGTGMFTEMFVRTGAQIVAVDISRELIEKARSRGLSADRVVFLEKKFEDCDVHGPFDTVIGSSVLHHLDIRKALAKIFELLKPGGVMCFVEPNMLNPQIMIQKNVPLIKEYMGDSADETAFIRWRIRDLLLASGFVKVTVLPCDWLHPLTPPSMIKTVMKAGLILEKLPIIREFSGSLFIMSRRPEKRH
ncbi:MAG: class I SAM-dependent methyltransferase [Deltaproteobacteria bacterium]|nr:class I SAM-dependent methyltransferase [Deltaproteobacteria bacterium]